MISIAARARAAGLLPSTVLRRIAAGEPPHIALSRPSRKGSHSIRARALAAGLLPSTVLRRIAAGARDDATVFRPSLRTGSLSHAAKAVGLSPKLIQRRVRRGETLKEALGRKSRRGPHSLHARAIAANLLPDTVRCRVKSHWAEHDALTFPLDELRQKTARLIRDAAKRLDLDVETVRRRIRRHGWLAALTMSKGAKKVNHQLIGALDHALDVR